MKQLSIKEKAKAYDEALKRAHEQYLICADNESAKKRILEVIFPELAESKNGKIRKELIEFVKSRLAGFPKCEEYIAYLEKQGEQKPIVPKFRVGDVIKHKDTGETFEVSKIEVYDADEIYYHLTNGGCVCENSDKFERVEQKPAEWSEEDEKIFTCIRMILTDAQEQRFVDYKTTLKECLERLKSLRPQNRWRPSEEQMEALVSAIDVMIDNRGAGDKNTILLSGLFHELKAL